MEKNQSHMQVPLLSKNSLSIREDGFLVTFHISDRNMSFFRHYHDYFEIVFYLGRKPLLYLCEGEEYQVVRGDIVLNNMFERHMFSCQQNTQYNRVSLGIDPKFLLHYSEEDANLVQIFHNKTHYPIFHAGPDRFEKYMKLLQEYGNLKLGHGQKAVQRATIHQLLAYLYSDCYEEPTVDAVQSRHVALVAELVRYIDQHLTERILLEELSKEVHYSETYICRIFKEITGDTLVQYILKKRISMAKQLLFQGMTISETAQQTGFPNYSYFYKTFKKLEGYGPREYMGQRE